MRLRPHLRRGLWLIAAGAMAACGGDTPTDPLPVAPLTPPPPVVSSTPTPPPWALLVDDNNDKYGPYDPGIKGIGLIYTRVWNGRLELRIEGYFSFSPISGMNWAVYLDTDRDARTGDRVEDIGADFVAGFGPDSGNVLRRIGEIGVPLTLEDRGRFVEVGLPLKVLGNPAAVDLVFRSTDLGPWEFDQAPDRGHVTLELPPSTGVGAMRFSVPAEHDEALLP